MMVKIERFEMKYVYVIGKSWKILRVFSILVFV